MARRADDAVLLFRDIFAAHFAHIALLDPEGVILSVNDAWLDFGRANGLAAEYDFEGRDYLEICQRGWIAGCRYAEQALLGLVKVLKAGQRSFSLVYPCHSPDEKRWFRMWVETQEPEVAAVVVAHTYLGPEPVVELVEPAKARVGTISRAGIPACHGIRYAAGRIHCGVECTLMHGPARTPSRGRQECLP